MTTDTEIRDVLSLDEPRRSVERVRLVNEMKIDNIGLNQAFPVELVGETKHAIAFLDLVRATTPGGRLGVVITSPTPGLKAVPELAQRLSSAGGLIPVQPGGGESTVVQIRCGPSGEYHLGYGYSVRGTAIERSRAGGNGVDVNLYQQPELITQESLIHLYRLTGNPAFIDTLASRVEIGARGESGGKAIQVDSMGYYRDLGMNPNVLRFMDEKTFEAAVKGIKRGVASRLHPDDPDNKPSPEDLEALKRMFAACNVLEDKSKRDEYSVWLKNS